MQPRSIASRALSALALVSALSIATGAHAADTPDTVGPTESPTAERTSATLEAASAPNALATTRATSARDTACEASVAASGTAADCVAVATTSVSPSSVASASLVKQYAGVESADGTSLAQAAAAGTIWTRTWYQEKRGFYYFNWKEKHIGRIFFDKRSRVWSTSAQSGFKGYHTCDLGYGILYDVQVKSCSTERRYDLNNNPISEWDRFRVHVVWRGIPLYATHSMHVNAYPNGNIYGH